MKNKNGWLKAGVSSLALAAMVLCAAGCAASKEQAPASTAETTSVPKGAELWAQNCVRCHNSRSPNTYDDAQWEVISMHMRVRANLTGEDSREILAFLKSAH